MNVYKSMGTDELYLRVLKKLVDKTAKLLFIKSEISWQSDEVPTGWKSGKKINLKRKERRDSFREL